jgi:hypothetical protein
LLLLLLMMLQHVCIVHVHVKRLKTWTTPQSLTAGNNDATPQSVLSSGNHSSDWWEEANRDHGWCLIAPIESRYQQTSEDLSESNPSTSFTKLTLTRFMSAGNQYRTTIKNLQALTWFAALSMLHPTCLTIYSVVIKIFALFQVTCS